MIDSIGVMNRFAEFIESETKDLSVGDKLDWLRTNLLYLTGYHDGAFLGAEEQLVPWHLKHVVEEIRSGERTLDRQKPKE